MQKNTVRYRYQVAGTEGIDDRPAFERPSVNFAMAHSGPAEAPRHTTSDGRKRGASAAGRSDRGAEIQLSAAASGRGCIGAPLQRGGDAAGRECGWSQMQLLVAAAAGRSLSSPQLRPSLCSLAQRDGRRKSGKPP